MPILRFVALAGLLLVSACSASQIPVEPADRGAKQFGPGNPKSRGIGR